MTLLNNNVTGGKLGTITNNNEEEKGLSGLLGRLDSQGLLAFAAALQEQAAPSTSSKEGVCKKHEQNISKTLAKH